MGRIEVELAGQKFLIQANTDEAQMRSVIAETADRFHKKNKSENSGSYTRILNLLLTLFDSVAEIMELKNMLKEAEEKIELLSETEAAVPGMKERCEYLELLIEQYRRFENSTDEKSETAQTEKKHVRAKKNNRKPAPEFKEEELFPFESR